MGKFCKRGDLIEAHYWDGHWEPLSKWAGSVSDGNGTRLLYEKIDNWAMLYLCTAKSNTPVLMGNYIICGEDGKFFSMDAESFGKLYYGV